MIESLFTWVSGLVEATPVVALAGAFLWGILSILLSPCHLTSIPLIIGYISDRKDRSVKKAFQVSLAFGLGILGSIALIGVITSLLGRMLGDIGKWGNYMVAGIFFLVGIYLLDIIPWQLPGLTNVKSKRKGPLGALILGFVFGVALGPCTFAFMAPILAITLSASAASGLIYGILLLTAYGVGHCLIIVLAGTFTEWLQGYLKWGQNSRGISIVKKICALLIIAGGIYLLTQ